MTSEKVGIHMISNASLFPTFTQFPDGYEEVQALIFR